MSYQQGTGQTSCHPHWFLHQAPETSSGALNPLQKAQQLGSRPMLETNLTRYSTVKTCAPPCSLRISSNFFSYAFWKNIAKNKYGSGSQFTSLEMKRYFSPSKLKRRYPILQVSWFCKLMQILQVSPTIYIYINIMLYWCHLWHHVKATRPALLSHEAEAGAASNEWAHLAHNTSSFRRMVQSGVPQVERKPCVPWHAKRIVQWSFAH